MTLQEISIAVGVALTLGSFGLSIYTALRSARKDDVEILRGVIAELRAELASKEKRIEELEAEVLALRTQPRRYRGGVLGE